MSRAVKPPSKGFLANLNQRLDEAESPEEKLDILLCEYRSSQTEVNTHKGRMNYLGPKIKSRMKELGITERTTETRLRRTIGSLSYHAKSLTGEGAASKAKRIRRIARRLAGDVVASQAVTVERKIVWTINWDLLKKQGQQLTDEIRAVVGIGSPTLTVGPLTKKRRRGE